MRERQAYRNRLEDLFDQISKLTDNVALQSHLVRFACVLVCGYVEVSLRDILQEYTRARTSREVGRYVGRQLGRFRNPRMEGILHLVGGFSQDWAENIRTETQGRLKDHVDSLVANRNQIAHGENVGLSYTQLQGYYQSALTVIELVEKQCGTNQP